MKKIQLLAVLSLALFFTACGGGGGGGNSTVATRIQVLAGVPIANATVLIRSLTDSTSMTTSTDASGNVVIGTLASTVTPPALVIATSPSGNVTFYSYWSSASQTAIAVNPITTTLVALAANANPSTVQAPLNLTSATAAVNTVLGQVFQAVSVNTAGLDFISSTFTPNHTGLDLVLDSIQTSVDANGEVSLTNKLNGNNIRVTAGSVSALPLSQSDAQLITASPVQACTNTLDGLTGSSLGSNASLYDNQGFLNNGLDASAFRSNIASANTQTPFKIATPIFSGKDGFGNYVFSVTLVNSASGGYISDLSVPMTTVGSSCVITGNHFPFELSIQPTIKSTLRADGVSSVNTTPSPVAGIEIQFGSQGMPLSYAGQTVNSARVELCDAYNSCSLLALLTNPGGSSNYMQLSASNYLGVNYSFLNLIPNPSFSLVNSLSNPIKVSFFSSSTAPTTGTANLIGSPIMTRSTADKFSSAEVASISSAMPSVPYTGTTWLASFSNPSFNFNPGNTVISSIQVQGVVSGNSQPQSMSKLVLSGTPGSVSFPGVVAANTDLYHALYLAGHIPGRNGMIETKYVWAPTCSSCY